MADNSWKNLEVWERVKWARERRYRTASIAAEAMGIKEGTYRCYERGPDSAKFIALEYKHAKAFAREFKVRWEWLLDGLGEPWLTEHEDAEGEPQEGEAGNMLRAWRMYRGLTVAELARKSGLGAQTISEAESSGPEISSKLLIALAPALNTRAGFLLSVDPNETSPEFFDAVESIPKERRGQALQILKTFRRYSKLR
jgi:transcriptional regulator with XRE-family HTH domain